MKGINSFFSSAHNQQKAIMKKGYSLDYSTKILRRYLATGLLILASVGSGRANSVETASIWNSKIGEIQSSLPVGLVMRLPDKIMLNRDSNIEESNLLVRVFSSETPGRLTVGLFNCDRTSISCLVGTLSVDAKTSASAGRELYRHQQNGKPITLSNNIKGYFLAGPEQKPSYRFSSVIWAQQDMIYTVTFPAIERQNILFMAYSMANNPPLRRGK